MKCNPIFCAALFDTPILTSLKKVEDNFQWLGDIAASALNWAADQPAKSAGGCASILENLFSAVPCEQPNTFMCESEEPEGCDTNILLHFMSFQLYL
jgi:hypothetical protein